jgi:hypothetical protein
VPHNFIRTSPYTNATADDAPDAQRKYRTRADVEPICEKHEGKFENLFFDAPAEPQNAYVLFKNGDVEKIRADLGGTVWDPDSSVSGAP